MKISEKDRQAAFVALAVVAIAAAACVVLFGNADSPADGSEFYSSLKSADRVGFIYDVRGADSLQAAAAYQCGVDIISRGRFAGKVVQNVGCDATGCILASTSGNGTSSLTYDETLRKFDSVPYILVKPGEPGYKLFRRHMEIYTGNSTTNVTCDISATEG